MGGETLQPKVYELYHLPKARVLFNMVASSLSSESLSCSLGNGSGQRLGAARMEFSILGLAGGYLKMRPPNLCNTLRALLLPEAREVCNRQSRRDLFTYTPPGAQ